MAKHSKLSRDITQKVKNENIINLVWEEAPFFYMPYIT